jgi:hypothetical protein
MNDPNAEEVLEIVKRYITQVALSKEIIRSSPEGRREYFESRTVLHANMNDVFLKIWPLLHGQKKELRVFIFGPSGVGKSALRKLLALVYLAEHIEELNEHRERLLLTQNELDQKSERYSWREFYRGALVAAQEPLIDCKILPRGLLNKSYIPTGKSTIDVWGNGCAEATKRRGVRNAFVDEADKLAKIPFHDKEAVTNPLIGLSRMCRHYFFGTYTLLDLRNLNGQIARRSKSFHFPRYHFADPKENVEFQKALNGLADQLPVEEHPDLSSHAEYICRRSNGSIGVLHDWLADALDLAMEESSPTVTIQHLQKSQPDDDSLRRLEAEAAAGEQRVLDLKDEYEQTSTDLANVEVKWVGRLGEKREEGKSGTGGKSNGHSGKKRRKHGNRRPGEMKPRKIPIGGAISQLRGSSSQGKRSRKN